MAVSWSCNKRQEDIFVLNFCKQKRRHSPVPFLPQLYTILEEDMRTDISLKYTFYKSLPVYWIDT